MPRIFDNLNQDSKLLPALQDTFALSSRADLCVGCFNLRGWAGLAPCVERWDSSEGPCRVLIGMQRLPHEELRDALSVKGGGKLGQWGAVMVYHLVLSVIGDVDANGSRKGSSLATVEAVRSRRKPTFLQRERWKAVPEAKGRGLSIRGMARELGIHRETVRKYIDAESPPMRRSPATPPAATSDTIAD